MTTKSDVYKPYGYDVLFKEKFSYKQDSTIILSLLSKIMETPIYHRKFSLETIDEKIVKNMYCLQKHVYVATPYTNTSICHINKFLSQKTVSVKETRNFWHYTNK